MFSRAESPQANTDKGGVRGPKGASNPRAEKKEKPWILSQFLQTTWLSFLVINLLAVFLTCRPENRGWKVQVFMTNYPINVLLNWVKRPARLLTWNISFILKKPDVGLWWEVGAQILVLEWIWKERCCCWTRICFVGGNWEKSSTVS